MNFAALILVFLTGCTIESGGTSAQAPTISMTATVFGTGTLSISGTVDLPPLATDQRAIRLEIQGTGATVGVQQIGGVVTTSAKEIMYSISNLPSGDYKIEMDVDETNDGNFGSSGDLEGWYDGTVISPVQSFAAAATVILSSVSRSNLNFGISDLP
jgi:hypothetical protein